MLVTTMFSSLPRTNFNFEVTFILSSANTLNFDKSKCLLFGLELKWYCGRFYIIISCLLFFRTKHGRRAHKRYSPITHSPTYQRTVTTSHVVPYKGLFWSFMVKIFALMMPWTILKVGHVRSAGQIKGLLF